MPIISVQSIPLLDSHSNRIHHEHGLQQRVANCAAARYARFVAGNELCNPITGQRINDELHTPGCQHHIFNLRQEPTICNKPSHRLNILIHHRVRFDERDILTDQRVHTARASAEIFIRADDLLAEVHALRGRHQLNGEDALHVVDHAAQFLVQLVRFARRVCHWRSGRGRRGEVYS